MFLCNHRLKKKCSMFRTISPNTSERKSEGRPDKSHFFLTRVKFLGHNIERKTTTPLKSRIDAIQKLQPPTNKKKIQEFLGMLNFLSKYVYKMQLYLRPFYNILRQQNNFEWNTEHQAQFEEIKKNS